MSLSLADKAMAALLANGGVGPDSIADLAYTAQSGTSVLPFDVSAAPYNAPDALTLFTTIAAASSGFRLTPGSAFTLTVANAATPFAYPGGSFSVATDCGVVAVTYTGITGNQFTGCQSSGYGVVFTGSKVYPDATAGVQAALTAAAAVATKAYLPPGKQFVCAGQLAANNSNGSGLIGGQMITGGGGGFDQTGLVLTGAGSGALISASPSAGFTVANLRVVYTNPAFVGRVIDLRGNPAGADSGYPTVRNAEIKGDTFIQTPAVTVTLVDATTLTIASPNLHAKFEEIGLRVTEIGSSGHIPSNPGTGVAYITAVAADGMSATLTVAGPAGTSGTCTVSRTVAAAFACVDWDKSVVAQAETCFISNARVGFSNADNYYVNPGKISGCVFLDTLSAPIRGGGEGLMLFENLFENLSNYKIGAFDDSNCTAPSTGPVAFVGGWMGDGGVAGNPWIRYSGDGLSLRGLPVNATGTTGTQPIQPAILVGDRGNPGPRTVTDGVTNATTTVTSASAFFTPRDTSGTISGGTIPAGAFIVTYVDARTVVISAPATGSASGVSVTITPVNHSGEAQNGVNIGAARYSCATVLDSTGTNFISSIHFENGSQFTGAKTGAGAGIVGRFTDEIDLLGMATNVATLTANQSKIPASTQAANYTLVLADAGTVVEMQVAGANTLTVPPNASVAFPLNTILEVFQLGAGITTFVAGAGVTLLSDGNKLRTGGQYATVSLRQRAANTWVLAGDLIV